MLLPELAVSEVYEAIGVLIMLLGGFMPIIYFLVLKKQRKQIQTDLLDLQEAGITVFIKKYERLLYGRDIGDVPRIARLLFNMNCLAIIQPKEITELKAIIHLCEKYRIPLIPRGAGTSGYGGTLPIKNGIIVILTNFEEIVEINKEEKTVEVECGVTWEHLRKFLESQGLTLQSYPSSGPSSTIGGWVAQGGYGVGSAKFGSVNQSVLNITVLGTEGKEFQLQNPDIFIGSCGRLGILWKITLKVKDLSNMIHMAVSSSHQNQLIKAISAYQDLQPFFLRYDDHKTLLWKNTTQNQSAWESREYTGGVISLSFQEEDWNQDKFSDITQKYHLFELPKELSEKFWKERFKTIRLKRKGPSLIVVEVLVPTIYLDKIIKALLKRYDQEIYALELLSTSDDYCIVFVWFPTDMRNKALPVIGSLPYTFHWLRFFDIIQIVRNWKGKPYSSGLWFSPYSGVIFKRQLKEMKQLKNKIDHLDIFNPGKVWGTRIPRFFPFFSYWLIIRFSVPIVSLFYRFIPKKFR